MNATLRAIAVALAAEDVATGTARSQSDIVGTVADRYGHPRTTAHPESFGYCPILDGERDTILAAYEGNLPDSTSKRS